MQECQELGSTAKNNIFSPSVFAMAQHQWSNSKLWFKDSFALSLKNVHRMHLMHFLILICTNNTHNYSKCCCLSWHMIYITQTNMNVIWEIKQSNLWISFKIDSLISLNWFTQTNWTPNLFATIKTSLIFTNHKERTQKL